MCSEEVLRFITGLFNKDKKDFQSGAKYIIENYDDLESRVEHGDAKGF